MKQLSGLDAAFLYAEDSHQPQHIGSLGIYDPSTAPNGQASFEATLQSIIDRAYLAPLMRQKLVTVPFNLDHPLWVRVDDFDVSYHIHHLALPSPGNWEQLRTLVSQLHEGPLDRSHPLWQLYLIEGLTDIDGIPQDATAVYSKIHHAALDGVAAVQLANVTHDLTPEGDVKPEPGPWSEEHEPYAWELLARAQLNNSLQRIRYADFLQNAAPKLVNTLLGVGTGRLRLPQLPPRTRFNSSVSTHRVFDGIMTRLDDLRAIKASVPGATINDVVLALCGGALRKYLESKGELPDQPLLAMAPISVRSKDQEDTAGNQISEMTVSLCTDTDGALQRLQAVTEGTIKTKQFIRTIGASTLTQYSQFIPAAMAAATARLTRQLNLTDAIQQPANCVVTNVHGSPVPLYSLGSQLIQSWGAGPLLDGTGLFHSVGSYCGDVTISATSCPEMMPDPAFYMEGMQETLDELRSQTVERKSTVSMVRKEAVRAPEQVHEVSVTEPAAA